MVECREEVVANKGKEFQTDRRVISSLKKFTNDQNAKCFVASSAMFAHNQMDGKVQIFSVEQLIA